MRSAQHGADVASLRELVDSLPKKRPKTLCLNEKSSGVGHFTHRLYRFRNQQVRGSNPRAGSFSRRNFAP